MADGAGMGQSKSAVGQAVDQIREIEKAIPATVDEQTKDAALRENGATSKKRWITNTEALQLIKDVQEITGERFPMIPTSKGGEFQIVQNRKDKAFLLYRHPTSGIENEFFGENPVDYHFNAKGFYTGASTAIVSKNLTHVEILEDPSLTGKSAIISQELLEDLKAYVKAHKKP